MEVRQYLNAADLIAKRFGVRTKTLQNPIPGPVGVVAQLFLPSNPRRLAFVIANLSVAAEVIAPDPAVGIGLGFPLLPGGIASATIEDDFDLVDLPWWIVAAAPISPFYCLSVEIY